MSEINVESLKQQIRNGNKECHKAAQQRYADDALKHTAPWLLWEYKEETVGSNYTVCEDEPLWNATTYYRHINPQEKPWELNEYGKLLIIIRKNVNGEYEGYCEESFNMAWTKNYAFIYMTCSQYSFLGEHKLVAQEDVKHRTDKFLASITSNTDYIKQSNRISKHIARVNNIRDSIKRYKLLKFWTQRKLDLTAKYVDWEVYDPSSPECPVSVYLNDWRMAKTR